MNNFDSTARMRNLLAAAFDDAGLDALALDHYPEVYDTFGRGLRKDEKITLLLDHCRRQPDGLARLAEAVVSRAPWTYVPPDPPDPDSLAAPGPKLAGWRLPFVRNALFTGRVEPLKSLAQGLLYGGEGPAPTLITQAVQGMGGVGKTQLAVELAYRYGRFFRGVHWLDARDPGGIEIQVAECGREMGLPNWPEGLPDQVACTLRAWAAGGPRLIVLDNLEEPRAAADWLARLAGGGAARILITARRSSWPRDLGLVPLRLEVFSPEESLAFLRRYLDPARAADADLAALAERLGHLPLALKLAGCYLEGHRSLKVSDYANRLADALADPSMEARRDDQGRPWSDQDRDLLACFMLSWERVTDAAARRVFALAGWCAPNQPIPPKVLEQAAELDAEACDGAAGLLAGLGLVEWEPDEPGPKLHPLLAEFGRTLEGEAALAAVAGALVVLSTEALNTGLPAEFAPLRAHVEAAAGRAEATGLEQAGALWNNLGYHRRMMADYGGARAALERALAIDERAYGPDHPNVATDVNNLGSVLRALGDLAGARAAYERALGIDERVYGPDHPKVAIRVNNLGSVLQDLGDLPGARAALERALAIFEKVLGPEHPNVATLVNNLGMVLKDLGDLPGARAAYERALGIDERVYGPDHPSVARDVNNLGSVLKDLGDLPGARAALERALAIWERSLPADHPNIRIVRGNLAGLTFQEARKLPGR